MAGVLCSDSAFVLCRVCVAMWYYIYLDMFYVQDVYNLYQKG